MSIHNVCFYKEKRKKKSQNLSSSASKEVLWHWNCLTEAIPVSIHKIYHILPNYRTYLYKRTVKQICSLQITASVLFVYLGICCWCSFELHRLVDAIQMSTHNIVFIKTIRRKKTKKKKHNITYPVNTIRWVICWSCFWSILLVDGYIFHYKFPQ